MSSVNPKEQSILHKKKSCGTARSLANSPSLGGEGGAEGEVCILRLRELQRSSLEGKHAPSI